MAHLLVTDIDLLLTMDPTQGEGALGALREAAVWVEGDEVRWVGPSAHAPQLGDKARTLSARGCVVLPGLVDCHTHAVWAGSRADEFRARLAGESYTAILQRGGGILSTVAATRNALEDDLVRWGAARLRALASRGVTTVEVKSGYGLSPEAELKLLRAARQAGEMASVRVLRTFLGAHAIPAEHRHDREGYVAQVIDEQLPLCAPEADAVDVYIDQGAFTLEEGQRILAAGKAWGLDLKVHAEQVIYTGAAAMAAKLGARSADHLERIDDAGIAAMAEHGTVAVMLPGAMLYLKDSAPPVAKLREAGVPMALATDLNPGSSPLYDPWTAATLACLTMGMTVEEALLGLTRHGASALGRPELGVLRPGACGDLVVMRPPPGEEPSPGALVQSIGGALPVAVCRAGVLR
jgi:imidazolonepropionase